MAPGNVVLLNGASSSGKTAIAGALQQVMDKFYFHTGIDHFLERVPLRFHAIGDGTEPDSPYGVMWVMPAGQPPVTELRYSAHGVRLFTGMYHAVAALARSGNCVVVDDVVFDPRVLSAAVEALAGVDALFVGVRCLLETLLEREITRADRMRGVADLQHDAVHAHGVYDLEVDTSVLSPMECALRIKERIETGPKPTALDKLRAR